MKVFKNVKVYFGILLAFLFLFSSSLPTQAVVKYDDGPKATVSQDTEYAYIQFGDEPIASYEGSIAGYDATKPQKGKKVDLNSPAAKKYGNRLEAQRNNYKKWLAKHLPQVEVVTEYDVTFNGIGIRLNGASLKEASRGPGAVNAGYSGTYHKAMSTSTELINAQPIWNSLGGKADAGAGIKVGVIDSGIDNNHPFLQPNDGMKAPDGYPKGDKRFTSDKVIVAKVFNQNPKLSAEAVESHGTHVSGTIAGKAGTEAPVDDKLLSGVAPGAYLGSYNVFPGDVEDAKSLFIAKAVEEAVKDGMDVLNLSLGGSPHKGADLLDMTVNAAVDAGVVVAISAGNEGPNNYTVGSPGTADKVITVAATTNSRTFAMMLESPALKDSKTIATTGTDGAKVTGPLEGEYVIWSDVANGDKLACSPITGTPLKGKIALIQRGSCTFTSKINNAAAAGADGVIIYQSEGNEVPIAMSSDGATIPAVMVGYSAGLELVGATEDKRSFTVSGELEKVDVTPNLLADFSSWGPTPNYTLKPDVAAPGVNIYSSVVGGGYELYQGTSMASPHVAGSAAVLLAYSQKNNLDWGPAEVKAALMGTAGDIDGAVLSAVKDWNDPLKVGGGLINLEKAMNPAALAFPSSLSFGLVRPVGNQTYQMTFNLENSTDQEAMYTLTVDQNLKLDQGSVTIPAKESKQITVTVVNRGDHVAGQGETPNLIRGYITATADNGNSIHVPYLYVIDYNR